MMTCYSVFVLLIFQSVSVINGLDANDQHVCPRYIRRLKPDGMYYQVLEMTCCPDYMEVDNMCVACPPGFYGQNCSTGCISEMYGLQCKFKCECTSSQTCNKQIGCTCREGFTGENCDTACPRGSYGLNCHERCLCSVNSECNALDGTCQCHDGWIGKKCDERCSIHSFGKNCSQPCNCPDLLLCDHVNGECLCMKGFTGKSCDVPCETGYYGNSCQESCLCSDNSVCDKIDGHCQCDAGWTGTYCNHSCTPGTFGANCAERCSCSQCNPTTGSCSEESPQMFLIVGAAGGAVVLVILGVLLVVVIYRCRHKSHNKERMKTPEEHSFNPYEDIGEYAEINDADLSSQSKYSYAYADDVKPPVKERKPTAKRKANQYLSVVDAEKIRTSGGGSHGGSSEYLNPYTGLLKDVKCASYHELDKKVRVINSSGEETGYIKPTTILSKNETDYDTKNPVNHSNNDRIDVDNTYIKMATNKERSSRSSDSSYIKPDSGEQHVDLYK